MTMMPRAQRSRGSTPYGLWLIWIPLFLAACAPTVRMIEKFDEVTWVTLRSGTPSREAQPIPQLGELSVRDYEIAMKRVIVNYLKFFGFYQTDPEPLFTAEHVRRFTRVLKQHVPTLQADQRLRFRFQEPHNGRDVLMDVYGDGEYLVFDFLVLSRDIDEPDTTEEPVNDGSIILQEGQQLEESISRSILREPILRDVLAVARVRQSMLDIIDDARSNETIGQEEAKQLRNIVRSKEGVLEEDLKLYMTKRKTLHLALRQELLTQPEFDERLKKIRSELERE